ncbi:HAD family hydrolase [Nocardioides astragali]|uniref:HAD family hydrolase n=1 Tax=Nocardioides astragali TaxID=1776736 RepID=A0ABW2N055_9ACTN|nr:HAD-IA family hydrolase [Nocardioides astragali]
MTADLRIPPNVSALPGTLRNVNRFGLPERTLACLFDLDGVLTQTSGVHRSAWRDVFDPLLAAHDQPPFTDEDYLRFVDGKPRRDGVRDFLTGRGITLPEGSPADPPEADTVSGVGNRKNELLLQALARDGVEVIAGSATYLRAVHDAGIRTAVVTSSSNGAEVIRAAGLEHLVEQRVDGLFAEREALPGKPQPDTFQAAARLLGVEPARAAVFEDALAGVAAGRAGGFGFVVGVDRGGQAEALREAGADIVVDDLSDLLGDQ